MDTQAKQKSTTIKTNPKSNQKISIKNLSPDKREELSHHVAELFQLSFHNPTKPSEEWDQYVKIQNLLKRINELEAPLHKFKVNANSSERLGKKEAFLKWAHNNDIQHDGVCISEFPGYGLGLKATRNIKKEEQLFVVPRKVILTEDALDNNFSFNEFDSMSNIKLAYTLMVEYVKPDSFWKPYIDLLPKTYNTVLYYSIKNMEELRGTHILTKVLRLCKSVARQYAIIYNCIKTRRASKKTTVGKLLTNQFNYELYRWAVSTVMTRQNIIPSKKQNNVNHVKENAQEFKNDGISALIPFWDMANHCQGTITSFFNIEKQQMESDAMLNFNQNEQIFICYGQRSNADMIMHNGFIDKKNPNDIVTIRLGINSSDSLYDKRLKLLQILNIANINGFKICASSNYISPELVGFVRVFNMNAEQLDEWLTAEDVMNLLELQPVGHEPSTLEKKSWTYLEIRLTLLLRAFSTTLEEDEKLCNENVENNTDGKLNNIILNYRISEKRILKKSLEFVQSRLKDLI